MHYGGGGGGPRSQHHLDTFFISKPPGKPDYDMTFFHKLHIFLERNLDNDISFDEKNNKWITPLLVSVDI